MDGAAQNYAKDLVIHIILCITEKTSILCLTINNKKNVTFMEYEQKYNAALERAKKEWSNNLDNAYKNYRERLEIIFPELKESEDGNMRKSIIYALQNGGFYSKDKTDEAIAWLEKQGHMLDPDKVIAWIHKYWPFSWGNFALLADDAIKKFKKDFEI